MAVYGLGYWDSDFYLI